MVLRLSALLVALLAQGAHAVTDAAAQREKLRREARQRIQAARKAAEVRVRRNTQLRVRLPARGDEDGDGVLNADDWCLHTRPEDDGSFDIDIDGCSPSQRDTDDDGVTDALDRCPGTPRRGLYGEGTLVDEDGCEIWVWRDSAYTHEPAIVQENVWETEDASLGASVTAAQDAGKQLSGAAGVPDDKGSPWYRTVARTATGAIGWIMHPPPEDRPLRTGMLCAAAAGLIGLLAAFTKNHVEKQPLNETVEKRIIRKIIR